MAYGPDGRASPDEAGRRGTLGFWPVALVFMVAMAGATLPVPLYTLWQPSFGFGPLTSTALFAVYALGTIIALTAFGSVSDRRGRRPVLLSAVLAEVVSTVLFALARDVWFLYAARLVSGIATGVITAAATASLGDFDRGRDRAGTVATAANLGGLALGPLAAGVLAQYAGHPARLVFWVYAIMLVPVLALSWLITETVPGRSGPVAQFRKPARPVDLAGRRAFTGAAAVMFAGFAVTGVFASLGPAFLRNNLGERNLAVTGVVVAVLFTAGLLAQVLIRPSWWPYRPAAVAAWLISGLGVINAGLLSRSLAVFVAGTVLAGGGFGLATRSGVAAAQRYVGPGQGAGMVAPAVIAAYAGTSLSTIGLGLLDQVAGQSPATLIISAVAAAAAVAAWVLQHSRQGDGPEQAAAAPGRRPHGRALT